MKWNWPLRIRVACPRGWRSVGPYFPHRRFRPVSEDAIIRPIAAAKMAACRCSSHLAIACVAAAGLCSRTSWTWARVRVAPAMVPEPTRA